MKSIMLIISLILILSSFFYQMFIGFSIIPTVSFYLGLFMILIIALFDIIFGCGY